MSWTCKNCMRLNHSGNKRCAICGAPRVVAGKIIRAVAAATLSTLVLATPAVAHHSNTSRVHNMREIAAATIGPNICGDTMAVPIRRGPMLFPGWVAYSHHEGDTLPYHNCFIILADIPWDTEVLCRVLAGHEYRHLNGWTAKPGSEYTFVDFNGQLHHDFHHSNNPFSIMYPGPQPPYAPCANGAANT